MSDTFTIHWRSGEGYGDFITGICYANNCRVRYQRPISLHMHWPNPQGHLLSDQDNEDIKYRFDQICTLLKPIDNVEVIHHFDSKPNFRFINELEEFNCLHGLWEPKQQFKTSPGLVMLWSSCSNLSFPGYNKDPAYDHWDQIIDYLDDQGYDVEEVTYRTPVSKVMYLLKHCEFGIGYEGMVHQLFKFLWKPNIILGKRTALCRLFCPFSAIINNPIELFDKGIDYYINESNNNIHKYKKEYYQWLDKKEDPTLHPLYTKDIVI